MDFLPPDDLPTLDPSLLAAAADLLENVFVTVIDLYVEDAPRQLRALQKALAESHADDFIRLAHTLKTTSQQLGLMRIGWLAGQLEAHVHTEGFYAVSEAANYLETELSIGCDVLRQAVRDLKNIS
jgi:HPt (histidine-containing phosphotransfer) domain-containing protein